MHAVSVLQGCSVEITNGTLHIWYPWKAHELSFHSNTFQDLQTGFKEKQHFKDIKKYLFITGKRSTASIANK